MIVRLTLAALFVVPAAMAYPWQSTHQRWLLGVAVAVVIVLFAWWRGLFLTDMLGRRLALLSRRGGGGDTGSAEYATVALRVGSRETADLPIDLVAGYVDRYGLSFDKVRVTSRDADGHRTTWVGLTLGAADNIAALSARSAQLPLHDAAQLAARRLADHLRETGWEVAVDESPDGPVADQSKEKWRGVHDDRGYLSCYRIRIDDTLDETLAAVWATEADEIWTAVEFTGSRTHPEIAAACGLRSSQRPGAGAPVSGLTPERGVHGPALAALAPDSDRRLSAAPTRVPPGLPVRLRWPAGAALSRT